MNEKIEKLLAVNPSGREVVRAWIALNAMIGNPALDAAQTEIKLAALHIEDAIELLFNELDKE